MGLIEKQFSKTLNQNMSIDKERGTAVFDDGTAYNRKEMRLLSGQSPEMLVAVHKVKNLFNGEVVR